MPTPCRCGADLAVIGPGMGPHALSIHCWECGVHRGWLPHETRQFLIELINKFGRPTEAIIIRGNGAGADDA
jgi:hypothetical protein